MKKVGDRHKQELLTLLKLFKKSMFLDFSYEEEDGRWTLFIHVSSGVIQINGDKRHPLKDTVYLSPIIDIVSG